MPDKLRFFIKEKKRYKGAYGGRGAAKSWTIADSLLFKVIEEPGIPKRILCARELQNSIKDSVHRLIADRIAIHKLENIFTVTDKDISASNGSMFIFKGLRSNITEIKSLEGIDYCWIEEAEKVSFESWEVLTPTIRNKDSEIWFSWNTGTKNDPVWQKFIETPNPNAIIVKVNYYDNPWFPDVLRQEMEHDKATDFKKYERIWLGMPAEGGIFFSNFNAEAMEEQPFVIEPHIGERNIYGGFDFGWGLNGWASYGHWYLDELMVPHRMMHWYRNNLTAQEQADDLFEEIDSFYFTNNIFPTMIFYDYEMDTSGRTSEDEWAPIKYFEERWRKGGKNSSRWVKANKKRIPGWQVVTDYLGFDVDTLKPKMKFWPQYNMRWKHSMESALANPDNLLDLLKSNDDHPCDETRYLLMGIRGINNTIKMNDARHEDANTILRELKFAGKIGVTGI